MAVFCLCWFVAMPPALAVDVPGPADVGRAQTERQLPERGRGVEKPEGGGQQTGLFNALGAPAGIEKISFDLKSIEVVNVTAFKPRRIQKIYADDIGKRIPLSRIWEIAQEISRAYADNGYFLSYAYVPAQKITTGHVKIIAVEGYIGSITLDDAELQANSIFQQLTSRLLSRKPVRSRDVEGFLLRLNEMPGLSFRSVLSPSEPGAAVPGAVGLELVRVKEKESHTSIGIDNYNSRFLGPHQVSVSHRRILLPMQATSVSASSAPRFDLVYSLTVDHRLPVSADWDAGFTVAYSRGDPAYTLKPQQIKSLSKNYIVSANYKPLRSRRHNLGMNFSFDVRDTDSNTLGTALVRESIRTLRVGMDYDGFSPGGAFYNAAGVSVSKGLDIFSASNRGQLNLSRGLARPDYIKIAMNYTNVFFMAQNWQLVTDARLQHAPQPLHSSEQFGYGGRSIGRAYDSSEILGDNGFSGGLELRYFGLPISSGGWARMPYAFYDIGKVWNEGANQPARKTAASAGAGIRFNHVDGVSANLALAFPLTKEIDTPIYGSNDDAPRILVQIARSF